MTEEIKKDRHRPGYWKERWQKQKKEGKQKDRHRPGYYREYNLKHPEWLARVGIVINPSNEKQNKNPSVVKKQNPNSSIRYELRDHDEKMGWNAVAVDHLSEMIEHRMHLWYDDEWEED